MQQNQYLTIDEAAQILRQAVTSIRCDITRNPSKLPPFLRVGTRILFPLDELHAHLRSKIVNKQNIVTNNDTKLSDHAHLNSVNKKRGRPRRLPESEVMNRAV